MITRKTRAALRAKRSGKSATASAPRARRYYTLLSREDDDSPWGIEFGAYDRADVVSERREYRDNGIAATNLMIVVTLTDRQADIDSYVRELNRDLPEVPARLHCDQCEMLSINGIACHEIGCPNMGARWDRESGDWIKQRKCFDCGCMVDQSDPCCSAPYDESE